MSTLVIIAAACLRAHALRGGGAELIDEHWPGTEESLAIVLRVADG